MAFDVVDAQWGFDAQAPFGNAGGITSHDLRMLPVVLERVMPFWIAALLPKTASAKARTAGHGGSTAKVRNAGRRRFGRNPGPHHGAVSAASVGADAGRFGASRTHCSANTVSAPKGRPLRGRIAASWAPYVRQVRRVAHSLRCARAGAVAAIQKGITRSRACYIATRECRPGGNGHNCNISEDLSDVRLVRLC
jgi:hypothetical protein